MIADERARVVQEAERWRGTPFHHGARIHGAGIDCANLLVAVFCGLGLCAEPAIAPYSPDWFLHGADDLLRRWVAEYCVWGAPPELGDIALFRFGRFASHAGIVVQVDPLDVVHSFRGAGVQRDSVAPGMALSARLHSVWTLKRWATCPD